jgi:anti-anti-sigma factor
VSDQQPRDAAPSSGVARVEIVGDAAVITLEGEHDLATVELVQDAFRAAEASAARLLVVDLAACLFIDSTIVRALLLASERAHAAKRRIVLVVDEGDAGRVVATVLRVSGIDASFEIVPTRAAALGHDATDR